MVGVVVVVGVDGVDGVDGVVWLKKQNVTPKGKKTVKLDQPGW